MLIFLIDIVFEIVIEIGKPCYTMQKIVIEIVIEIYMEQTRLFQCNRFHYAIFVIEIVIEFFSTSSARSLYDNFCKTGNDVIYDVIVWVQDGNCKKNGSREF